MCWSPLASGTIGTVGMASAFYFWKKDSKLLTLPLVYFSLMEFIQFFSYFYIDSCSSPPNNFLTFLAYVHIAFQPVFMNMQFIYYGSKRISYKNKKIIYGICLFFAGVLLIKLIPLYPGSICTAGQTLCGTNFCTVTGKWHLAWQIPTYNFPIPFGPFIYYLIPVFIMPLFYGARKAALITFLLGPVLTYLIIRNTNEWPAVWCLYSVLIILFLIADYTYKDKLKKLDRLNKKVL